MQGKVEVGTDVSKKTNKLVYRSFLKTSSITTPHKTFIRVMGLSTRKRFMLSAWNEKIKLNIEDRITKLV